MKTILPTVHLLLIFVLSCQSDAKPYAAPPKPEPLGAFTDLPGPASLDLEWPQYDYLWRQYQAESLESNGTVSSYEVNYRTLGSEASGRQFISLAPGQSLSLVTEEKANSLVVRFSLPDNAQGTGTQAPLEILVDGSLKHTLDLNSEWSYAYGNFPWSSDPQEGLAHKFWDEAQTLLEPISPGQTLELRFGGSVEAEMLHIDLIDLEWVPSPLPPPVGFVNILDYGAVGDGMSDNTQALDRAILVAVGQDTGVYIPPGEYKIGPINLTEFVRISGAGLWHSRFVGSFSRFNFRPGGGGEFRNFAIFGDTDHRDDNSARDNAFSGTPSQGTVLEKIWVEHKKCAFWVGNGGNDPVVQNLTIRECRFRNLMADAVNFCNGAMDNRVLNTHVRYSGDDALATWSAPGDPPAKRNRFMGNWIQLPWLANGIALYGGEDHLVAGNRIEDNIHTGSGLYVAAHFRAAAFTGTHHLMDNTLVRAGTLLSDQGGQAGAMRVLGWDSPINRAWILLEGNRIENPVSIAITFHGRQSIQNILVRGTEFVGEIPVSIEIKPNSKGGAQVFGLPEGFEEKIQNRSRQTFTLLLEN